MAPRKRVDKIDEAQKLLRKPENADDKVEKRGRIRKNTNNLENPTLIKVQIPAKTVSEAGTKKARVVTAQNLKPVSPNGAKKSRVVTTKTLSKSDIKIMLANEVVQAHFSKVPIFGQCMPVETTAKRKPRPKKLFHNSVDQTKSESVDQTPSPPNTDVVEADITEQQLVTESQPQEPIAKGKLVPKKRLHSNKASCGPKKTKPVTLSAIDSDASAFEDKHETKPKKRPKSWQNKNVDCQNAETNDTEKSTVKPAKRSYVAKRSLVIDNMKMKKGPTQDCGTTNKSESKPLKRNAIKKVKASVTEDVPDENSTTYLNKVKDTPDQQSIDAENSSEVHPAAIGTRKTSAVSEAMSWTKDISSSSTTTCVTVCSNDFVRFDNKLPIVKLTNINKKLETDVCNINKFESLTDDESAKDNCDQCSVDEGNVSPVGVSRNRSLSLSSLSSSSSSSNSNSASTVQSLDGKVDKIGKALDELTLRLKKFDMEIMYWIGYENENVSPVVQNFHDKVYEVLKEECEVITQCQKIKRVLRGDDTNIIPDTNVDQNKEVSDKSVNDEDFIKPDNVTKAKCDKNFNEGNNNDLICNKNSSEKETRRVTEETVNDDIFNNTLCSDKCNDDEDALSLFAESISGFESAKKNNCVASASNLSSKELTEYVPQPLKKNSNKPNEIVTYCPTKIGKQTVHNSYVRTEITKTVCEKQNADSTSIYKESQDDDHKMICNDSDRGLEERYLEDRSSSLEVDEVHKDSSPNNTIARSTSQQHPKLITSLYKPIQGVKSVVLGGVCFFNLIFSCKNANCRFSHSYLNSETIKSRLTRVNEELFIEEYMMLRNWSVLRRQYGLLFVMEGIRRELTRIVVEMAIDFIIKANFKEDKILKVEVVETVLLHLNTVDIKTYSDLLKFNINNGDLLCDIFMQTLAETQNFSRFKLIFINLTNFICHIPRQFGFNVATLLLERLCILPFEKPLTLALLSIIKNTSSDILQNSMISILENQLASADKDLYDELQTIKDQMIGLRPVLNYDLLTYPPIRGDGGIMNFDLEQNKTNSLVGNADIETRCSPDTTNLDSSNKTYMESIITRTIDSNRIWSFGQKRDTVSTVQTPLDRRTVMAWVETETTLKSGKIKINWIKY